jgi:hypothetical protein
MENTVAKVTGKKYFLATLFSIAYNCFGPGNARKNLLSYRKVLPF